MSLVKVRSCWRRQTGVLIRRGRQTQREEGCKDRAKDQSNVPIIRGAPGVARDKEEPPLVVLKEAQYGQHLDFRPLVSRTETVNVCRFKPPRLWCFVRAMLGNQIPSMFIFFILFYFILFFFSLLAGIHMPLVFFFFCSEFCHTQYV